MAKTTRRTRRARNTNKRDTKFSASLPKIVVCGVCGNDNGK